MTTITRNVPTLHWGTEESTVRRNYVSLLVTLFFRFHSIHRGKGQWHGVAILRSSESLRCFTVAATHHIDDE
jgi:hypothetical protein